MGGRAAHVHTQSPLGFFCDFDGTISTKDRITAIMREFVPEASASLIERVNHRELSVRAAVEAMFALIPSARFDEVREFVTSTTVIREGFSRFVDYATEHSWPIAVVSGGFDFFVDPAIAPWRDRLTVFYNRIDTSGEYLRTIWPHPCDALCDADCGLCKPTILRSYEQSVRRSVVIGDGVTDFEAARHADFVYARASLLTECQRHGLPHQAFETFDDIVADLSSGRAQALLSTKRGGANR
ncbi:MtnX-like HAD-IB family phosphatase [Alicyclobacillus sp. ALC3]|nr:MtnX-like HAD-IB family phosphatase [Alicyclobacillus sp. ALC3]